MMSNEENNVHFSRYDYLKPNLINIIAGENKSDDIEKLQKLWNEPLT